MGESIPTMISLFFIGSFVASPLLRQGRMRFMAEIFERRWRWEDGRVGRWKRVDWAVVEITEGMKKDVHVL